MSNGIVSFFLYGMYDRLLNPCFEMFNFYIFFISAKFPLDIRMAYCQGRILQLQDSLGR